MASEHSVEVNTKNQTVRQIDIVNTVNNMPIYVMQFIGYMQQFDPFLLRRVFYGNNIEHIGRLTLI